MEFLVLDTAKSIADVVARGVFEEFSLAWGFNSEMVKLKDRLLDTQALMNDLAGAEESQLVIRWIQKLKGVAISAENLIDDYAYEMLRRKQEVKIGERCRNWVKPVVFCRQTMHRVNKMLSDLDQLCTDPSIDRLKLATRAAASTSRISDTNHAVDAETLGQNRRHANANAASTTRKEDVRILLEKLLYPGDDTDLHIISIVGIGGLGKTTVARQIFEHETVSGQFMEKKVWISVSKDFSIDRILREMIEAFTTTKHDLFNTEVIINKLKRELKEKKYFLVLDDVWNDNEEQWDSLKASLRRICGLSGSAILITTRRKGVAKKASSSYTHSLNGLSKNEGWDLLKQHVFNDETMPRDSSFDDVGKQIVNEKCEGVPLAIKSIGGLLQSKKRVSEWESINNNELWNINSDDGNYIMPSLLLSYNNINDEYVQQCFAYCSILPKDSVMEKGQLIALWLAQGLLHHDNMETSNLIAAEEKIGEDYINILVNYSFLQEKNDDNQTRYKMHHLVHDLATYVFKKNLLVWKVEEQMEDIDSHHKRHLVLKSNDGKTVPQPLTKEKMRKLRTISFWNGMPMWNFLICARYMRTLVMSNVGLKVVSSDIGQLPHLRYLDLSDNEIEALPESLCKLYQLQTLRLLRCSKLKKLPRDLHRLEKLRHINTSNPVFASSGLQKLTCLQALPCLELCDGEGWTIDELGYLKQLKGDVYICGLEHVKGKDEAGKAGFEWKNDIQNLNISWGSNSESKNDEDVLGGLKPHPNIEMLHINSFKGGVFPEWMMTQLIHLRELKLSNCKRCKKLPSLGELPKLAILRLEEFEEMEHIGKEFHENERNINEEKVAFPSLKELHIIKFEKLTRWMHPSMALASTAFPKLETLCIEDCEQLRRVSTFKLKSLKDVSFKNVGGIKTIDIIKGSPNLKSICIQKMGEIKRLPQELSNCSDLQKLEIDTCEKLKCIPSGIFSLRELHVWRCSSLETIEDDVLDGLRFLRELRFDDCSGLKRMAKSLEDCTSLENLYIHKCPSIEDPIPDIGKLQGLKKLWCNAAGRMTECLPRWISKLDDLTEATIGGWGEEWDMSLTSNLSSLKYLTVMDCPNLKAVQPLCLFPSSLQMLSIQRFEDMEELPEWIGSLSSLQELHLWNCNKLEDLPSIEAMSHLSKLHTLFIHDCSLLKERCAKGGDEWPKIERIRRIMINFVEVQNL